MVQEFEQPVQNYCSISQFRYLLYEKKALSTDCSQMKRELKRRGYSNKAIEEIMKWYV